MQVGIEFLALCCLSLVEAELVYIRDLNSDHERRNLYFGLPENLDFRLFHSGKEITLNLRENKRLNANAPIYEPATDKQGNTIAVQNPTIRPNTGPYLRFPAKLDTAASISNGNAADWKTRLKYYQDHANGAFMTGECMPSKHGPCVRILTGNLVINGQEHKLEPAMDEMNRRELPSHLGTPHKIEVLTRSHEHSRKSDYLDDGKVVTVRETEIIDYVTHKPENTVYSTTTEDYDIGSSKEQREKERILADEFLIERLIRRLNRQKRTSPIAHGVEMLVVLDHVIYNDFAARYTGDSEIKYRIREYYVHILNGVDLSYASIQESDISIYVTISGFFISNDVSTSPWMNYAEDPTDGSAGLDNMVNWRTDIMGLPEHDHACLITGTDIHSGGAAAVVGIAFLNGVCRTYRVSINEELGFFEGSGLVAHELGHNLGAYHDNNASIGCDPYSDFIMSPVVPRVSADSTHVNPWRFSPCSVNYFRNYFDFLARFYNKVRFEQRVLSVNFDCTLNRAVVYNESEYFYHLRGLAGQIYNVEQQCILLRGEGASFCSGNQNTSTICRKMGCRPAGSSNCYRYVAAHGTPCGNSLMCFEGICQEPIVTYTRPPLGTTASPPVTPEPPTGEYQCTDTGSGGLTCPEMKTIMGNMFKLCKYFYTPCCQYCYANKGCKKDRKINGAEKYTCSTLIGTLGLKTTCILFPFECCISCQSLALPSK